MPLVQVHATVELDNGHPLDICFPAQTRQGLGQWGWLEGVEWQETNLFIPAGQFAFGAKVHDAVRCRWSHHGPDWADVNGDPTRREGAIVVVLESPHADEYDMENGAFLPLQPLSNPSSQTRFRSNLERLVREAADTVGVDLREDLDVVLRNPVQFQTSLHRFVPVGRNGRRGRLLKSVRNATWRGLWRYGIDGLYPLQEDFLTRLNCPGPPSLILNACTKDLREEVGAFLGQHYGQTLVNLTSHVAGWNRNTTVQRVDALN
jgi:hypothetical protein